MNQADVSKVVSKLRYTVSPHTRKFRTPEGPKGRLDKMRKTVTALFKYERLELRTPRADEARGYAERLISDAIRHGDTHAETMRMADFWILEKQLIHKLFKVLVPRFQDYSLSYTRMLNAPRNYPEIGVNRSILELRGNPYPPIMPEQKNRNFLHNVLLEEARKEVRLEQYLESANALNPAPKETELASDNVAASWMAQQSSLAQEQVPTDPATSPKQ